MQYIAIAILLIALLFALLYFTGILHDESSSIVKKLMDFIAGR